MYCMQCPRNDIRNSMLSLSSSYTLSGIVHTANLEAPKVVAVAYRRSSFTWAFNCKALTGKMFVFSIGGRLWGVVAFERWFNFYVVVKFFLGLNFIFLCLKLIIIHYHTQKQRKVKFKPRKNLNHNIYILERPAGSTRSRRLRGWLFFPGQLFSYKASAWMGNCSYSFFTFLL